VLIFQTVERQHVSLDLFYMRLAACISDEQAGSIRYAVKMCYERN